MWPTADLLLIKLGVGYAGRRRASIMQSSSSALDWAKKATSLRKVVVSASEILLTVVSI